jgi:hypothetical protein
VAASLFAAACVDTTEPGAGLPGGGAAIDNPGSFGGVAMTGSVPRVAADCGGYPATGAPFELDAQLTLDPVPALAPGLDDAAPYRWDNVTIKGGGFVSGIVFSTAAPNLIYARTDVGGAYRYDVSGGRWLALTDWVGPGESNLMGIESIAADPSDPARVYLAAGTYLTSGNGMILSSANYGRSFERHSIAAPMGGNVNGRSMGERLAVDPNLPSRLYFGSRNDGLFVSEDFAGSWQRVASFPVTGALDLGVSFVLFDAQSGAPGAATPTLYVGVARLAADDAATLDGAGRPARNPTDALFRSLDGGQSWQAVPDQPAQLMPHHAALDGAGRLYLSYSDRPGPNDIRRGGVFRLDTQSGLWADITPPRPAEQRGGFAGVSADLRNPGVVLVSTMDVWSPDEIYRSTSAGECWTAIGPRARRDVRGAEWVRFGAEAPSATGWMGDIEIDPFHASRALYITGQGIWWSDDVTAADAAQPTHWSFVNEGLEETVALGLVSPPAGARLLTAVGDIAGFRHDDFASSPPSGMFDNPRFGNTSSLDFAELAPQRLVRVGTNSGRHGAHSSDGGSSWTPFASEPPGSTGEGVVAISADGASIVWDPRGAGPHYSRDEGASWTASSGYGPPDGNTGALVADRINPLLFYGRAGGNVFVSRDGGANFSPAGSWAGGNGGGGVRLRSVFGLEGQLWVSSNSGLFRSGDAGASFERIAAVSSAAALGFGQAAPGASFPAVFLSGNVDGRSGLYRSDDAGGSWQPIDDEMHKFGFINHLTGDPRQFGRVYLGTGGRGIVAGDPR